MKIGILTYHRANNYGALLQAIATRTILEKMGHDVSYIDYWPDYHKRKYDIFSINKFRIGKFNYIKTILLYYSVLKKRIQTFNSDIDKYIQPYCTDDTQFDAIIYGSDQIWRKQSELGDFNYVYFAASPYKAPLHIAFAASMGNVDLSQCAKLKDYWKLFVKNENDLSEEKHYSKHFKKEISQKEIVQYLINTNKTLKATYECYQGLINALKERNFNKFKSICFNPTHNLSIKMKAALKLYRENIQYIENSFKYDINNGIVEGTNNLIKCLKRIAFGYRKYDHFIARIFLIKGIIKG